MKEEIFSKTLKASIKCPNCGTLIEDEIESMPNPNVDTDSAWESRDSVGGSLVCSNCGKEVQYSISEDFNGYRIVIPDNLEIIEE